MVEKFIHAELTPQRYQMILDKLFEDWLNNEQNYLVYGSAEDIFKAF